MSEQSTAASGSESAPPVTSGQTKTPAPDRAHFAARRAFKRARRRAYNPFYFSPQSLALTLALVMLAAVVLLALTFSLRGDAVLPVSETIIEIINAPPAIPKADQQAGDSVAGQSSGEQIILAAETPENLALAGPPVPTVVITNTPAPLAVGLRAAVYNVGNDELNVRNIPSLTESEVLFRAPKGTRFDIIGGPQEADGFTWWQLHDAQFQVDGWAVANYLQTIAADN